MRARCGEALFEKAAFRQKDIGIGKCRMAEKRFEKNAGTADITVADAVTYPHRSSFRNEVLRAAFLSDDKETAIRRVGQKKTSLSVV